MTVEYSQIERVNSYFDTSRDFERCEKGEGDAFRFWIEEFR